MTWLTTMLALGQASSEAPASPPAAETPQSAASDAATSAAGEPAAIPEPPPLPEVSIENVQKWADHAWDLLVIYGPRVLGALILLFLAWMISRWVRAIVFKGLTRAKFDLTLSKFFANTIKWVVLLVAVLACLDTFGFSITSFAAILGAVGLAIGLGFQGSLGNLAAGVMLLVFRPFKIGDAVVIGGQTGIIDGIDLFTTNLDTFDMRRIILPNSSIFGSVIENSTHHPRRRIDINVPIDHCADLDTTRKVLLEAARKVATTVPGALGDPAPEVVLTNYAVPMPWLVLVWARTEQFGAVREQLIASIKQAVEESNLNPKPLTQVVSVQNRGA
ncbi:MAG: mechanosensitive ion channel [Planctomycetota bacterium]|nr:mechanosensitive ion channel [Planctomycetota bacterium]